MKLLILAASHRKQSINRRLAELACRIAQTQGAKTHFPEYGDFDMPIYDDETYDRSAMPQAALRFDAALNAAHGMIIASPEYNWSFPGSLKNIIDWASVLTPNPFAGKTALLLSASPSLRGGAQGLVQLKVPLEALEMFVYPRIFTLSCNEKTFSPAGDFGDAKLQAELEKLVAGFMRATSALSAIDK